MDEGLEEAVGQAVTEAVSQQMLEQVILQGAAATVMAAGAVFAVRYLLARYVRGNAEIYDEQQRRWLNRINNGTFATLVILLAFIWAPQIHTFALSLTAFAVAVVLTIKELLMCLTGGFYRASTNLFDVGDWVTVDDTTGEVLKITGLATTLQEIETINRSYRFTGRTIQVPNSHFLSAKTTRAEFLKKYIYQDIPITVHQGELDPDVLMAGLQDIATKCFDPFREEAINFNRDIERKAAVDFDDPSPRYFLRSKEDGQSVYTVRMFVPTEAMAQISTDVTQAFLKQVFELRRQE